MVTTHKYITSFARSTLSSIFPPARPNSSSVLPFLYPVQQQTRDLRTGAKTKAKDAAAKAKKKRRTFRQYDMKDALQFSLCDAMRYIRAFEAGRQAASVKYEVHLKLRTKKDGPVIRNQLNLPHAVHTGVRVCVIAPPGSRAAKEAKAAGADIVGERDVFEQVKAGNIEFEACICHSSSLQNLNKAGLGRVLGPKGLMPSAKLGTVVDNVGQAVRNMRSGSIYRERAGVIRMPIGRLGFSPEELRNNLRTFIGQVKKDAAGLSDQVSKEIAEVVLSSTNAPGFSLNGEYKSEDSPPISALTGQ
ncbi:mitochondrial 54S ribosomal protein MRPL1 [Coccidioides immitis RS]|uniref:Ribosomal protein L1 n=4 Tax=Coccidioides immitis TaxID=5501 RepID=J3K8F1_COCIM|nr:mitochondrial 54S ribosomal protein MRPL1 [Coccidioides immitis RS]KMP03696.1 50S ribosomal protein L1 [Coccidioides immitis RMSCC 2394]KMU74668.1 50S ribosomal protein L1 [Coccidioides immitis RMSCC 3703]KMU83191.1 50S ribosomal protein L1 [Coccidioides immitis H538.4]TPX23942.1 mitochondrial 54S ribosomal protein mrpl1 [Coccidioides immitis]EAS31090.3 ribosomal protein L1 [Coccidioides immitis RS]